MPRVIIRESSYDYAVLKPIVFEIIGALDAGLVRSGSRVSRATAASRAVLKAPPDKGDISWKVRARAGL
jgi:hypothetical protein